MSFSFSDVFEVISSSQCTHEFHAAASTVHEHRLHSAAEKGLDPAYCLGTVTHSVSGALYCGLHAGAVLLAMAVRQHKQTLSGRLLTASQTAPKDAAPLLREAAAALAAQERRP